MGRFKEIALPLIAMNIPITPVRPNSKVAFLPNFQNTATTDLKQIEAWDVQFPDHNAACLARAEDGGVWLFETDSPNVVPRILAETGKTLPDTFRVRSRPGRGHYYFRQTPASIAMGNLSQTYVVGQDWSARVNNQYVVAPGSLHPDTGQPYQALDWNHPIIPAPDWFINWLTSQKIQKTNAPIAADTPRNTNGRIPHGAIHGWMLSQAGRLRNAGLTQEEIEVALLRLVHEQCEPPIDDEKVVAMAKSICSYAPGAPAGVVLTASIGTREAALPPDLAAQFPPAQPPAAPEPEETIIYDKLEYPVFPRWVMENTSLYEGFVKPYCEKNSRIAEFMWLPAVALMLNYLGGKVKVPFKGWPTSLYIVVIGKKGRTNKSSSIASAKQFFEYASTLTHFDKSIKNAEGRSIVWEVGSPEGLGIDMTKTSCRNAVLHYDELSGLVGKARIEGSGLNSALLKMYESQLFANSTKNKKDAYSLAPGTYTLTVLSATTDKKFTELWSQLAGEDTGLDDRFFFLLEPQVLPPVRLEQMVPFHEAALNTRKLIDKAVNQKEYKFFDQTPLERIAHVYGNRAEARAEKFALYFAIDLNLDEIDEDCVERGIAMVKYERDVKKYLMSFEAKNDQAQLEIGTIRLLKKAGGLMATRDIERELHVARYNTTLWFKAFNGLQKAGYIYESGKGVKGDPKMVKLLRDMHFGDTDD